ncbi:MAG: hypothetical protein IPG28_20350 [Betaproteobacteria bacterium]|nr:hypothetical protein [Betaproteobacteria bacterium]
MQDDPWDHSTFPRTAIDSSRHDACTVLFEEVLAQARRKGLLSAEHFSVDGTLVRAWASNKSFVPKDGPPPPGERVEEQSRSQFPGAAATNDTHEPHQTPVRGSTARARMPRALPYFIWPRADGESQRAWWSTTG